ncbi:hypothetical protein [Paenibacillus agaridevorans]|uniref:hypothetical protein n=1 Tax=Paenibacillus agaridevorans TaxID=171404 RepID=UPI001BE41FBB|nr:hypothetical protein [Paenibacillus agaridevorans]
MEFNNAVEWIFQAPTQWVKSEIQPEHVCIGGGSIEGHPLKEEDPAGSDEEL